MSGGPELEGSVAFLEFEYVLGVAAFMLFVLIYMFYVRYPYNKDMD